MLTSSNQYLRPEYLTPLPTTLDAKKSPLALLAQTCSQIGADSQNSKLIGGSTGGANNSEKKTKDTAKEKNSKSDSPNKANFKPYETSSSREKSRTPEERASTASTNGSSSRVRTPSSKSVSGGGVNNAATRCSSNQSATSARESPAVSERKTTPAITSNSTSENNSDDRHTPSTGEQSRGSPFTPSTSKASLIPSIPTSEAAKELGFGAYKPAIPVSSAYLGGYPPGFPLGMDLMTSSLMSQHHAAALKAGGLSPYLNYARLKSPADPMCRDPYCTGCSLSSHLMVPTSVASKTTSCPAGCTQCDHVTSKAPSYLTHNPAAAAYAHAQLAALAAASHLPHICNWISSDGAYCGKRFSSSEELLTHLRTHTSVASVSEAAALSMLSAPGLSTHPLLHRTYPTPPLSPLATARYHPYSKPSLLPPSLTSSPLSSYPLTHPGLPPYLSPYSLYGPRLGSAPGMHP